MADSITTSPDLIRRVVDGDVVAWQRFVDLYSSLIYSKCRVSGLGEEDAADIVQNVFLSVHRSIARFHKTEEHHGFRRWLRTIARNAIADHFRRLQKSPGVAAGGTDLILGLQNLADPFADEKSFSANDDATTLMLRRAVQTIRDDYETLTWKAFWLTAVEAHRPADVARDLGLKPGTVRQAKYKILSRLRCELEDLL